MVATRKDSCGSRGIDANFQMGIMDIDGNPFH